MSYLKKKQCVSKLLKLFVLQSVQDTQKHPVYRMQKFWMLNLMVRRVTATASTDITLLMSDDKFKD